VRSLLSQKQRDNFRKPERQSERPAEAGSAHRSAPPRRKGRPRFASFLSFQFLDQGMKGPESTKTLHPHVRFGSAFTPRADIAQRHWHVWCHNRSSALPRERRHRATCRSSF
jgi:hypothetical protein